MQDLSHRLQHVIQSLLVLSILVEEMLTPAAIAGSELGVVCELNRYEILRDVAERYAIAHAH